MADSLAAKAGARPSGTPILLALVGAGLAGNYFKYPLFLDIDFIFGSIFAMLALQFFGMARGVLAAVLIASYTYVLWNQPYGIVLLTGEAALVGWLMHRYKTGLVLADALYWFFVGMPLCFVFYRLVLEVAPESAYIIMTKQAVNGIANALLARLIFAAWALRARASRIPSRDLIYNLLAVFALGPVLILMLLASRSDFAAMDANMRTELQRHAARTSNRLQTWVKNRSATIIELARLAPGLSPSQMNERLDQARASDVNFLRIGRRDFGSRVIAYSPLLDEEGKSNVGKVFSERPYIATLRQELKPMLSEVVMARIGAREPIVVVIAPVLSDTSYDGYVNGVLSLAQVRGYLDGIAPESSLLYTLIDYNGNVILSNRHDQKQLRPFVRGAGSLTALEAKVSRWVPELQPNTSIAERWRTSLYVTEISVGDLAEWRLVLEQPVAPYQKILYQRYTQALAMLLLVLLGALALAEFISRRVSAATERLSKITRQLPSALAQGTKTDWPESQMLEPALLIENFRDMAASLLAQFDKVRQANETLERRVEERTQALQQSEQRLRESQKMEALGTLAGGVAHEFNNALAMISGNVALAREDVGAGHPALESLDEIAKASRRVQDLVQQILAFSRRQTLDRKATSLALVVVESARLVRASLPAMSNLSVHCASDAPAVLADATQIKQLLLNLCNNAAHAVQEARRPGSIEVRLEDYRLSAARGDLQPGRYARLTVQDNGIGMDAATRQRMFEPFFTTRAVGQGMGLGLSVVHGIVREHQGCIEVVSSPGSGTRFDIYFPAVDMPAEQSKPLAPQADALRAPGKRVLYVDDEQGLVLLMQRMLGRKGLRVSGFTDPRAALAAVRACPQDFDLAVTDYNMPEMSGLDLARELSRLRPDLPIILASGYITEEVRAQAPGCGVRELIHKPNTADDLCEAIVRLAQTVTPQAATGHMEIG